MSQINKFEKILVHLPMHKTASTWFQQYFFCESNGFILLNNSKNPKNDPIIEWLVKGTSSDFSFDYIVNLLEERIKTSDKKNLIPVISAERLTGHPINGGIDRLSIAFRINKLFKKSKIIVVRRKESNKYLKSIYYQLLSEGYYKSYKKMISENENSWKETNFSKSYFDLENYINILEKNKKVEILDYDNIFNKNLNELSNTFLNIGITLSNKKIDNIFKINHNKSKKYLTINTLIIRFFNFFSKRELSNSFINLIPGNVSKRINNFIIRVIPF